MEYVGYSSGGKYFSVEIEVGVSAYFFKAWKWSNLESWKFLEISGSFVFSLGPVWRITIKIYHNKSCKWHIF